MADFHHGVYVVPSKSEDWTHLLAPTLHMSYRILRASAIETIQNGHELIDGCSYLLNYTVNDNGGITVLSAAGLPSIVKAKFSPHAPENAPLTAMIAVKIDARTSFIRNEEMYALADPVGEVHVPQTDIFETVRSTFWKAHAVAIYDNENGVDRWLKEWLIVDSVVPVSETDDSHVP